MYRYMRHGSYLPTHARSSGSYSAHAHVSCNARMHHHGSYPAHAHIHTPWRLYDRLLMQCFTCQSCQARDYHAHSYPAHAVTHAMLLWGLSHFVCTYRPWQPACPCIHTSGSFPAHAYIYIYTCASQACSSARSVPMHIMAHARPCMRSRSDVSTARVAHTVHVPCRSSLLLLGPMRLHAI